MPTAMSKALPKDTIQYGCEIVSANVTPTGNDLWLDDDRSTGCDLNWTFGICLI